MPTSGAKLKITIGEENGLIFISFGERGGALKPETAIEVAEEILRLAGAIRGTRFAVKEVCPASPKRTRKK